MSAALNRTPLWRFIAPMFRGFDGPLAFAVFVLMAIGLVAMYSAAFAFGVRFNDHLRNMLLAAAIMFLVAQIPPQKIMALAIPIYVLGVTLLLGVALFGITKKGATRWINVGVVIQPSEFLKIAMPLLLAWWFQKRSEHQLRPFDYAIAFVLLAVPVALIMKQPDLGTALLVLMAGASVIYFAGLSWKLVLPPLVLGMVAIGLLIAFEPRLCAEGVRWSILREYQQQRVCTLLNPMRDPLGKGFMRGTQTHLEFIPERTTDFIFAAFAEEFGLLGNIVLLLTFLFLIYRILWIAAHARGLFERLLAAAIGMTFFTYAFVNMGMVSGILPVVGVPLPFISYGGTAMITLGLALGIVFSIGRYTRLQTGSGRL